MEKVTDFRVEKRKRDIIKRYELDRVDQVLLEQLIQFPSTGFRELASLCGLSISGTRKRTMAPGFKKALADASGVSSGRLAALSAIALSRLEKLVKSTDDRVALSAIGLVFDAVAKLKDQAIAVPSKITFTTTMTEDGRLFQDVIKEMEADLISDSSATPATVNS